MNGLTHLDKKGNAIMVDVTDKDVTSRYAVADGRIYMSAEAIKAVSEGTVAKGDVLAAARVAGIMAAKKTSELIPLCHPLQLTSVIVDLKIHPEDNCIGCECHVKLSGRTGAEMEALQGVSTALLTIYDMCKAIDRSMVITDICLKEKSGGKSGHFMRETK